MPHVGIDLEQFATDPYRSGIQRVLQQLAIHWPSDVIEATFVVPHRGQYLLLSPNQAAELIGVGFSQTTNVSLHNAISSKVEELSALAPSVSRGSLAALFSSWMLPEVSYLPIVQERFEVFDEIMPTVMIGYDALPMTDPGNYRFKPGQAWTVSRYFRALVRAYAVVCISTQSKIEILSRLRRDAQKVTTVAHPGGDHVPVHSKITPANQDSQSPLRLLRLGTLEARKRPLDALAIFEYMKDSGIDVELTYVGAQSSSDQSINDRIQRASSKSVGVTWIDDADDPEIYHQMKNADIFLSLGTEGFGIPVLESVRLGTPVVFEGSQPAAELMMDHGAFRLSSGEPKDMALEVCELSRNMERNRDQLDPHAVPRWGDFARAVADVCQ